MTANQNMRARRGSKSQTSSAGHARRRAGWLLFLMWALALLSACGGSSKSPNNSGQLAGNWQITKMALDTSLQGGIQGGFLTQKGQDSVNGQFVYSFSSTSQPSSFCNSGTATVDGTVDGQNVTLNVLAGSQTYTLKGTLSSDGTTLTGTYDSTDGHGCGTAQTGLQWSAVLVPPLSGAVQGDFHSTGGLNGLLVGRDFPVTGILTQGPNTGASSATVTGTLSFQGYPCLASASVTGEITGNSVILQVFAANGLNAGALGSAPVPSQLSFAGTTSGYVVRGAKAYAISTSKCPQGGTSPGDLGNVCLALGHDTGTQNDPTQFSNQACTEPVTLTPGSLTFPAQVLGMGATSQSLTLTNTDPSGATVSGLNIAFAPLDGSINFTGSDFNGIPNFSEQDTCSNPPGSSFSLAPQQSCTITVTFDPQQSCPWVPANLARSQCPPFVSSSVPSPPALTAITLVTTQNAAGDKTKFQVPATGVGLSAIQPSAPELDFGSESLNGPGSAPQSVTFTNQSNNAVQVLPAMSPAPCGQPGQQVFLPRPLIPGKVPGIQAATRIDVDSNMLVYVCDVDPVSGSPSFPFTSDTCSGKQLGPLQSCTVAVKFAPQPQTQALSPDYSFFLQLNTLECTSTTISACEIDAGRFPVALKANLPSPLRMSPGAALNFGIQAKGQISVTPLTLTLSNDPTYPDVNNPSPQTVNITGILIPPKGDYTELDDCLGQTLTPGQSCSISVSFTPQVVGFDQSKMTITFNNGQVQTVFLRGTGQ